jgi:hypothetical protein
VRYRKSADDLITSLDKSLIDHKKVKEAIEFYKKNREIKKEGCFIATEIYGGYSKPEVVILRTWRDKELSNTCYGRLIIKVYYFVSPKIVLLFRSKPIRGPVKHLLGILVTLLEAKQQKGKRLNSIQTVRKRR